MNRIVVYVEGPSDRDALKNLLSRLLARREQDGVAVKFVGEYREKGDRKKVLLTRVPARAVDILRDPHAIVVVMPDLYPRHKGFPHETVDELRSGIRRRFEEALEAKGLAGDARLLGRFKVFCFKHDMEVLLLAARESLAQGLGAADLEITWTVPVEDQDHERPPRRVVEDLFRKHGRRYKGTVHAPAIMRQSSYTDLAGKCPQCFKPFVEFLEGL